MRRMEQQILLIEDDSALGRGVAVAAGAGFAAGKTAVGAAEL